MSPEERSALNDDLASLSAGDASRLESVMTRLDGPVRRLCARMLGDGPDSEDAAQEALVELFGRLDEFDPRRDGLAWALTIAAWECRTVRRRRSRARLAPVEAETLVSPSPSAFDDLEERELRDALVVAIGELRPGDREVLDAVLDGVRGDAAHRKRKERMLHRLRDFVRRIYDIDL